MAPWRAADGSPPDVEAHDPAAIQAVLNRLADAIDPAPIAAEIADMTIREIPELARRADEDLRSTLGAATIESLLDVWDEVRAGATAEQASPPRAAVAYAYELVHRGVDLQALLRTYRFGHALVEAAWERRAHELDIEPELRWRALAQAFRFFFRYVDAVCVELTQAYAEERARWVRGTAATRAEMVQALLDGERIPAGTASRTLGYDVSCRHIGFTVWADPDAPDPGSAGALEGVAASVARSLGDGPSMLVNVGNWVVWGWVAVAGTADGGRARHLQLPSGVRAAVGDPADGLDGFVRTHQEAMRARRVASLLGRRAGATVRHRAVALLALLSADPLAAARFVESELGELAAPDDHMARLRATLRVYLEENASPARTAGRLSVNKNTVVYRVAKVEEILGHGPAEHRSELDAALRLADVLDGLREAAARSATGH
jgi:PucR-like helix-turn-helix protein/diguanylate cyclase with GGDEF domain